MAMWGGAALAAGPGWKRKMSQDQLCGTKVAYESLRCQTYSGWEVMTEPAKAGVNASISGLLTGEALVACNESE